MINPEKEFHALLAMFATNSRINLNQTMLRVYDMAVQPYGYVKGCEALEKLMLEVKTWQMPTPKQITDIIDDKPSKISEANEVAGRIFEAINKHGWSSGQAARTFIGELGWTVVQRFGGWHTVATTMGVGLDAAATRAQMRDCALSLMDISEHRDVELPPGLPEPKKQLDSVIKLLSSSKEIPK